jgi:hypothetical protein
LVPAGHHQVDYHIYEGVKGGFRREEDGGQAPHEGVEAQDRGAKTNRETLLALVENGSIC